MLRYSQLVTACAVLGAGVGLILEAALGSDGYSTLVSGLSHTTGLPFWQLNIVVGAAFLGAAWARGTRPGPGTAVQWLLVGFVVSAVLELVPTPTSPATRAILLGVGLVLITVGVAAYLASATGAGPVEAMALAWDPPVPFRWGFTLVQGAAALAGWLLGGAVGPGTLLFFLLVGHAVDSLRRTVPALERDPAARS